MTESVAAQNQAPEGQKSDDNEEVKGFLTEIKLDKYYEKFIDNGVEDLETILELKDEHIEQMGIPLGHKLKIIKKIKDLRTQKGMSVPQSRQGTRRPGAQPSNSPSASTATTAPASIHS